MATLRRGGLRFSWWAAWVLWCVPAGALAGVGLIEFNWGGPPYDGGFMGDLVLFGGFLALGQLPFVAAFFWLLLRQAGDPRRQSYAVAAGLTIAWPLVGFVGWTLGSYIEVSLSTSIPLYSDLRVLAEAVRWLVVGVAEGVVLAVTIVPALRRYGRAAFWALAWIAASVVGGLLYEAWSATEIAARSNALNEAIGRSLEGFGVAENVAYVVVPHALFVPVLYGVPTGAAFVAIRRAVLRWAATD
jgi:hypothetical protein